MSYAALRDRLTAFRNEPKRVAALPDGSVDRCYRVSGPGGDRFETPEALARYLRSGDGDTVPIEPIDVRPGGQAVNAASQVHALGDDAALVGHLDHPVFATLPFETRSMGSPTEIHAFVFDGEERLFPDRSTQAPDWDVDDLRDAVEWDRLVDADALCCANWASYRGLVGVFDRLAERRPDDLPVVVDPGAIELVGDAELETLLGALTRADAAADVYLSVDPNEYGRVANVVDASEMPTERRAAALRSELEIAGIVSHGADEAIAATCEGTAAVEMLEIDDPMFTMGAGDRFSGALACALARDWPREHALALGNACAASFVATGETAALDALESRLAGAG
ncbi:carbohydrate kinase family protein [Halosolutus gelatinilyticus]|uniref:carbohydrate kinase family protein n=1 Tax=Halosolutus gelatinilyticus TaxID=2931975 RepID=UPI001FF111BA|nr:carbohydrate kinase family protein [Halosolutus gelatinilyticus]